MTANALVHGQQVALVDIGELLLGLALLGVGCVQVHEAERVLAVDAAGGVGASVA